MDKDSPQYSYILSHEQIVQVCRSPGVRTVRLNPHGRLHGCTLVEVVLGRSMAQPSAGSPTIQGLHILSVDYDWTELLRGIGELSTLKELTITLAPPDLNECHLGQVDMLPHWYYRGIPEAIHGVVGAHSQLTDLTLRGFHAFGEHRLSGSSNDNDLLAQLTCPEYVPRLTKLILSGFAVGIWSAFWTHHFQIDGEEGILVPGKLPLKHAAFNLKPCRPDLPMILPVPDQSIGSLEAGKLFLLDSQVLRSLTRTFRIDITYDLAGYIVQQLQSGIYGYTYVVNEPRMHYPGWRQRPMGFPHVVQPGPDHDPVDHLDTYPLIGSPDGWEFL